MTAPGRHVALAVLIAGAAACGWWTSSEPHLGEWKVTRIAAGKADGRLVGTQARYAAEQAQFGDSSCAQPTYSRRWIAASAFADAYEIAPGELGLPASGEIGMVDVTCRGGSLAAGSTLILKGDDAMLMAWDGTYYELARQ